MLTIQTIGSLDLPELEPYRTMRRTAEHERRGVFVAEGDKVVRRLLDTPLTVLSVLVTPEWLENLRPALAARKETVHAYVGEKKLLEGMVGFELYHGLLALAQIPAPRSLDEILAVTGSPRLFVALDGLASSENLGVMVRNCAAFQVQALLIGETCGSPWLRRAVRNSMGAVFLVPVVSARPLAEHLRTLESKGIRCIAAHPHAEEGQLLPATGFTRDCCIVLGSEGHGISPEVLAACSIHTAIPMPAHVDSLNVSSAAAVFLYEVSRQRAARPFDLSSP
jgi:tRNA G18 (ribose-2'-O)-methylase SpoU